MINKILLAFIPLFVAMDVVGTIPIFIAMTSEFELKEKRKIIFESLITAFGLAIGFVLLGKLILKFLGVTLGDFMIAGGAVLFCIAIMDIIKSDEPAFKIGARLGVVPLGTPLVVGPAVLTTSLICLGEYGLFVTLIAIILNIIIVGIAFLSSEIFIKIIGISGSRVLSKVTSLLLVTIAIMLIRKGVFSFAS